MLLGIVGPAMAADPATPPCTVQFIQGLICTMNIYDPSVIYGPAPPAYSPPQCAATTAYDGPIGAAYTAAPWKVKDELCKLKKIVVQTDDGAYSWGYFENPETRFQPDHLDTYVGIRRDLTGFNLKGVLDKNFSDTFTATTPGLHPDHTVPGDSNALGLLFVLAHEIGHIKWHRDNIYASLPCYYRNFVQTSWTPNNNLRESVNRIWHPTFSDENAGGYLPGGATHPYRASHSVANVPDPHQRALNPGQVRNLYTNGFVSAVAGISPEEDFVETYALQTVLSSAAHPTQMITMQITGGGNMVTIPDDSSQSKRQCVGPALVYFP